MTPHATRKRAAETALDRIRTSKKPDAITPNMSDAKKTALHKAQQIYVAQEIAVARLDEELRRVYGREIASELELVGGPRASNTGFGVQLHWYFYHTRVHRMTISDYDEVHLSMETRCRAKTPQEVGMQMDRYFTAFEEADRTISEPDKERLFLRIVSESIGPEAAALLRRLPREWKIDVAKFRGNLGA